MNIVREASFEGLICVFYAALNQGISRIFSRSYFEKQEVDLAWTLNRTDFTVS
jgi:hypothetical protein